MRVLEQGPERKLFRGREQILLRAQARKPLRQQGRQPLRDEDRALFRAPEQRRNQVLLGFECRRLARGPSMGPMRLPLQWPERLPLPTLLRRQERGPFRGQAFPQPSRRREKLGQCRDQNADTRSQNSRKDDDLGAPRDEEQ